MSKLLTVVTSTYNKGDRNRASIKSVLNQTFREFEYIIINDGSSDNTKEILSEFDDPRIAIINQTNQGFVKTMASVMSQIKTPYVAIQGAGDISLPDRFQEQIRYLEAYPDVGVVSGLVQQISASEIENLNYVQEIFNSSSKNIIKYHSTDEMINANIINHGEAMIRLKAYQDAGGYRHFFRYAQDRDLWLRILENYSLTRLGIPFYIKVTDPKFDVYGNPKKAEEQALFSLYARFLARSRKKRNKHLSETELKEIFLEYLEQHLSKADRDEVVGRVFRNALNTKYKMDEALNIIKKYNKYHRFIFILKVQQFLDKKTPIGGKICQWYYHKLEKRFLRFKSKIRRLATI
jgi:glycosyltransferase involved in cell wall biosynthesis